MFVLEGMNRGRTFVQFCFGVFQDVASDAGPVCAVCDAILQSLEQGLYIYVSPLPEGDGLSRLLWEDAQQRDVILPVVARAAEVAHAPLHVGDLVEQLIILVAGNPVPVVECERSVERISLPVCPWVEVNFPTLGIGEQFFDADVGFEVNVRHVRLDGGAVERSCGGLAAVLAGFVPWGSSDGEALRGGYDGVEGM